MNCQSSLTSTVDGGQPVASLLHANMQLPDLVQVVRVQNSGRWSPSEHQLCVEYSFEPRQTDSVISLHRFLEGIQKFGLNYNKIALKVLCLCPFPRRQRRQCKTTITYPNCSLGGHALCKTDQTTLPELVAVASKGRSKYQCPFMT